MGFHPVLSGLAVAVLTAAPLIPSSTSADAALCLEQAVTITGTKGPDPDRLDGGGGNDRLEGGDDNDRIRGGEGDDELDGFDGSDALDGGPGTDECDRGETLINCET